MVSTNIPIYQYMPLFVVAKKNRSLSLHLGKVLQNYQRKQKIDSSRLCTIDRDTEKISIIPLPFPFPSLFLPLCFIF